MKNLIHAVGVILAALGVLFLVLLFLPDDEKESTESVNPQEPAVTQQAEAPAAEEASEPAEEETSVTETPVAEAPTAEAPAEETVSQEQEPAPQEQEPAGQAQTAAPEEQGNRVEVVIPASEISKDVLKFRTTTLDEKTVSQEIFSGYDLTIVHVWGTYCTPCIREMGEYAKLYDELPDNVNLVGLMNDVYDGIDSNVKRAKEILDDNGAKFTNLRTGDDLYENVIEKIQYVPSTFFVDREGHIVGEILDGVGFDGMKKRLDGYLK
ncbi:MAG: TlpA family protein disulfide reductase [Lachnospiraceae bacterium]|nr:TlpA family protein disulfide reductase [Lachnospiraceae bacterium]